MDGFAWGLLPAPSDTRLHVHVGTGTNTCMNTVVVVWSQNYDRNAWFRSLGHQLRGGTLILRADYKVATIVKFGGFLISDFFVVKYMRHLCIIGTTVLARTGSIHLTWMYCPPYNCGQNIAASK